jgi:hypothetical protein
MVDAVNFFMECINASAPKVCVENPVPHKYASELLPPYTQVIHPCQFGNRDRKATCLWLKGLPPLKSTEHVTPVDRNYGVHDPKMSGMKAMGRGRMRSITHKGVAEAMATQWG